MFCTACRTQLPSDARYCSRCGAETALARDTAGAAVPPSTLPNRSGPRGIGQPVRGSIVLVFSLAILGYGVYRITALGWVPRGVEWLGALVGALGVVESQRRLRGIGRFERGWKPAPGSHREGFLVGAGIALAAAFFGRPTLPVFIFYAVVAVLFVFLYFIVRRGPVALPAPVARPGLAPLPLTPSVAQGGRVHEVAGVRPGAD